MARLKPDELQAARVRSGRLGGRPRKPTVDEARSEALERLLPKATRVLEEHLDSGRPDAWRSALRVLEHGWGRAPEHLVPQPVVDEFNDFENMSTAQLVAFVRENRPAVAAAPDLDDQEESIAEETVSS